LRAESNKKKNRNNDPSVRHALAKNDENDPSTRDASTRINFVPRSDGVPGYNGRAFGEPMGLRLVAIRITHRGHV
jgi:hypothetical protein